MSPFIENESGLIVPMRTSPERPKRKIGALEVDDPDRRLRVEKALKELWDALAIGKPSSKWDSAIDMANNDEHYRLYQFLGQTLLGPDCPEFEILC